MQRFHRDHWDSKYGHEYLSAVIFTFVLQSLRAFRMSKLKYQEEKYSPKEKLINGLRGDAVSITHPMLVPQWIFDSFGAECFSHGSTRQTWWVCENEHYFERPICRRTRSYDANTKSKGCPYCSGRLSLADEGLEHFFPDLAKEWDYDANGPADTVHPGSRRTVRWTCAEGHAYACMVLARTEDGQSCPQCYVGERFDIAFLPADVSVQFNRSETNLGHDSEALAISQNVWWACTADPEHSFYRSVAKLRETSFACPQCLRKNGGTLVDYPQLIAQFHPTLNDKLKASDLLTCSHNKVWWYCQKHPKLPWQARVNDRTRRGDGCPYCTNKRANADNCLAATHPHITKDWHPDRNGAVTPETIVATSTRVCWWLCPCGNAYSRQVCGRVRGSSCLQCKSKAKN